MPHPEADSLIWTDPDSPVVIPEPQHVALLPIDDDEYIALVDAQIALELDLLICCALHRHRES